MEHAGFTPARGDEHMSPSSRRELQSVAIAVLISIALGSLLILIVGKAPGHVWWTMLERTVTNPYELGQVLYKATALTLTALAFSVVYDAGLFNIGGEAQLTAGVLGCATVGAALPDGTPSIIAILACVLAAAVAGGMIGALIGAMRVYRGVHEILTAIMINAITFGVALWLGNTYIFRDGTTRGAPIVAAAELPQLGAGGSPLNAAVFITAAVVALVWFLRTRTTWGQAWRVVGQDPAAARTVGINVERTQMLIMITGGALAGLAATNFVLGHKHAFEEGLGRGFGFLGIAAALLGRTHPVGVAVAAIGLSFLSSGGLAVADLVPKELTEMLQGIVVLAVAVAGPWVRRHSREVVA
jgi:general nucleoside transport system permease protein